MENKEIILAKDIYWYIGAEKENNTKAVVVPYVYNKEKNKFKNLKTGEIYSLKSREHACDVISKVTQSSYWDLYDCYDLMEYPTKVFVKEDKVISKNKLIKIVNKLEKLFSKAMEKLAEKDKIDEFYFV
ncbi:MAG: hypothetical protein E7359_02955 [Clostridiales bacterium]|nr:hypothetical protein [Clostridiales bacterium]